MSVLGVLTGLASRRVEIAHIESKRPTFVPGAPSRLWARVRRSGFRRSMPLPLVKTRQNVRAALRRAMYARVREQHPGMPRCERRALARALAARDFRTDRGVKSTA